MRSTIRKRGRRWSLPTAVAMFAFLLIPFAGPASANHGDRKLDVEPETATRGVGAPHTLTARLCENDMTNIEEPNNCNTPSPADQSSGSITIRFENEGGVNDPDGGASRTTPDLTCHIFPVSTTPASCSVSYTGQNAGNDTWRAWIDHDGDPQTDESDATEGRNEETAPGATTTNCGSPSLTAEPDCTDVVQVTWSTGGPATLDCDDLNGPDTERETNPSGGPQSNETYSCEVRDEQGNPTGDADPGTNGSQQFRVHAEVENGVNDPQQDNATYQTEDYGCNVGRADTTGEQVGRCDITITQAEGEVGTAEICFWVGTLDEETGQALCGNETTGENQDGSGADTGNDLADQTEKTWEERTSTKGGLDAEPETSTNVVGQEHTITATVFDQFGSPVQEDTTVKFEFFQGSPADPEGDGGNTPGTPDRTCETNNTSGCSIKYTSNTTGRDLVCVWTNNAPLMIGDNQDGTCDGESRDDADDQAHTPDAPEDPRNDDVDVVSKTWHNENPATELNCVPESDTTERTSDKVITCTASNQNGGVGGTEIDVEASGANDPDNSSSPGTPDRSCRTNDEGTCAVTFPGSAGNELGSTTYRAWIDEDYFNGTDESDQTEGQREQHAGTEEPDNTDVVRTTWVADPERTITLNSNRNSQEAGKRVRFFGDIEGDPNCQDAETVRLRRRVRRGFRTIATTVTDNDGGYRFRIVVRRSATYKAVTPATTTPDRCDKAKSNTVELNVTR